MLESDKYDDNIGADYQARINILAEKYHEAHMKAEHIRLENGDQPCEEEVRYLVEAAKYCEAILGVEKIDQNIRVHWEKCLCEAKEHIKNDIDIILSSLKKIEPEKVTKVVDPKQIVSAVDCEFMTTPSGFRTRNAIPDILSAERIESWYQSTGYSLDQIVGMQNVKNLLSREVTSLSINLTDRKKDSNHAQTLIFYGPPGTGKTYLIDAFAHEMMEQGFKYLKLSIYDICSSYVGESEKIIAAIFREAVDAAPSILFIDEIESVCANREGAYDRSYQKNLTNAFLEARSELYKSGARVVLLGATNQPWEVDPALLNDAKLYRISLPDEESRRSAFERGLRKFGLEDGFTMNDMVEATEGCSFSELSAKLIPAILDSIKNELFEDKTNWVLDEKGEVNREETINKIAALVDSGTIVLRREIFDRERKALNLPSDKTEICEKLLAFEKSLEKI